MKATPERPIIWMGDSNKRLRAFPKEARREIGVALFWAQQGRVHDAARPMRGSLREAMEITTDCVGDTFRAMYTTRIGEEIYVLHAFQKKAKRGIATPKHELALIARRLRAARLVHARRGDERNER